MKKILFIIVTIAIILSNSITSFAEPSIIDAPSYMLIDPATGQILYEYNADAKMYPASTTKIMTAILAIESGNLDRVFIATPYNTNPGYGGASAGTMNGEELTLRSLLHALLIKSANETANIIADNICPTRSEFVDLMNKKAVELGATNTHFVTTNGMHDDNHYSTVHDLAKIAQYAMTLSDFRDIVKKTDYTMPITNKHDTENPIHTTNRLFYYHSDYYNEVTGIKTGYTREAGNNLVSSVKDKNGMELLAVVFGCRKSTNADNTVYGLSRTLFEYGYKNYSIQKIIGSNELIKSESVSDASSNTTLDLVTGGELRSILSVNLSEWNLEKEVFFTNTTITAPIKKGQVMGTITYKRNGVVLGKVDIVAAKSVDKSIKAKIKDKAVGVMGSGVFQRVIIGGLIAVAFFFLLRITLKRVSKVVRLKNKEN